MSVLYIRPAGAKPQKDFKKFNPILTLVGLGVVIVLAFQVVAYADDTEAETASEPSDAPAIESEAPADAVSDESVSEDADNSEATEDAPLATAPPDEEALIEEAPSENDSAPMEDQGSSSPDTAEEESVPQEEAETESVGGSESSSESSILDKVLSIVSPVAPGLTTDKAEYSGGEVVTFLGAHFAASVPLTLRIEGGSSEGAISSQLDQGVTADENGAFTLKHTIENAALYTIIVLDQSEKVLASVKIEPLSEPLSSECEDLFGPLRHGNLVRFENCLP